MTFVFRFDVCSVKRGVFDLIHSLLCSMRCVPLYGICFLLHAPARIRTRLAVIDRCLLAFTDTYYVAIARALSLSIESSHIRPPRSKIKLSLQYV